MVHPIPALQGWALRPQTSFVWALAAAPGAGVAFCAIRRLMATANPLPADSVSQPVLEPQGRIYCLPASTADTAARSPSK